MIAMPTKTTWTATTRKALATGGWVDLHTELMTLVVGVKDDEPLVQTVEARQLPTPTEPYFDLGPVTFHGVGDERTLTTFVVSNDHGVDLYRGTINERVECFWDVTVQGIRSGIEFT